MDHERFPDWFSHVDELTAAQRKEVATVLSDPPEGAASLAAIELGVDDERRCPVPPIYLIRGASRTPTGPPALVMAPSSL